MARNLLQEKARVNLATSIQGNLDQLNNAAAQVVAVVGQLTSAKAVIAAGVAGGDYDQADVDKIDELTPKVAAFLSAAQAYLE